MEDPLRELPVIVHALTTSTPIHQQRTIESVFVPSAAFSHPLVLVPPFFFPFPSRTAVLLIYRFYKFLSPNVDVRITSIALDSKPRISRQKIRMGDEEKEAIAYVRAEQTFRFWFWPFWDANVELVSQVRLVQREENHNDERLGTQFLRPTQGREDEDGLRSDAETVVDKSEHGDRQKRKLWYIKQQKDLYQFDQFVAYLPFLFPGGPTLIRAGRMLAALGVVTLVTALSVVIVVFESFFGLAFALFGSESKQATRLGKGSILKTIGDPLGTKRMGTGVHSNPTEWLDVNHPEAFKGEPSQS